MSTDNSGAALSEANAGPMPRCHLHPQSANHCTGYRIRDPSGSKVKEHLTLLCSCGNEPREELAHPKLTVWSWEGNVEPRPPGSALRALCSGDMSSFSPSLFGQIRRQQGKAHSFQGPISILAAFLTLTSSSSEGRVASMEVQ